MGCCDTAINQKDAVQKYFGLLDATPDSGTRLVLYYVDINQTDRNCLRALSLYGRPAPGTVRGESGSDW